MPLSRQQLSSVQRLLREARNLVADAQNTIQNTAGAEAADLDMAERLGQAGRALAGEIGLIQDKLLGLS